MVYIHVYKAWSKTDSNKMIDFLSILLLTPCFPSASILGVTPLGDTTRHEAVKIVATGSLWRRPCGRPHETQGNQPCLSTRGVDTNLQKILGTCFFCCESIQCRLCGMRCGHPIDRSATTLHRPCLHKLCISSESLCRTVVPSIGALPLRFP